MQSLHDESPLGVYLDFLKDGKLAYQVTSDGEPVFFPRVMAPGSGNTELKWRISAGAGTVYSSTVVYPRNEAPYNVVLIDMDEGYRLMSRVDGIDPCSVTIGMRVKAHVQHDKEGVPFPVFHPVAQGEV
jgi:uncharacterized OB-fold protein